MEQLGYDIHIARGTIEKPAKLNIDRTPFRLPRSIRLGVSSVEARRKKYKEHLCRIISEDKNGSFMLLLEIHHLAKKTGELVLTSGQESRGITPETLKEYMMENAYLLNTSLEYYNKPKKATDVLTDTMQEVFNTGSSQEVEFSSLPLGLQQAILENREKERIEQMRDEVSMEMEIDNVKGT